jgi:lycopene cyclase domain-containing protein
MTYFNFLIFFVILPAAALTLLVRPTRKEWAVVGVMVAIVYVWTTPWDNYLVGSGVWYYDPALISGFVIGWVPIEEYLFFGLQCWLTGTWTFGLKRVFATLDAREDAKPQSATLLSATILPLSLAPLLLTSQTPAALGVPADDLAPLPFGNWNYLVLILAWAVPVILGQLWLGWPAFRRQWKVYALGFSAPAIYLTLMDSIAIGSGTWTISPLQSLNIFLPFGVPVEEGIFFLVTNLLLVQGLLLFTSPEVRERLQKLLRRGA